MRGTPEPASGAPAAPAEQEAEVARPSPVLKACQLVDFVQAIGVEGLQAARLPQTIDLAAG